MIVVDIESTGVNPVKNSLVSVGAVEFENPANQFYAERRVWDGAHVDDDALKVNGFTRAEIADPTKPSDRELLLSFLKWAETCAEKTFAGQNVGIDRDFLKAAAERYHVNWPCAYRVIDLHSIAYFHARRRGIPVPSKHNHSDFGLDKILVYAGLPPEPKPHHGLMGAKLEAEAFSRLFDERPLFREWSHFPIPWLDGEKSNLR